jgi:hypothetical protein
MKGTHMAAVVSLLTVLTLSFLIVRVGTVALMMTGLSQDVASFQSLSAFSGVGFTTGEAESVVANRSRRTIVATLIRLGSAGIVTVISSSILSFAGTEAQTTRRIVVIIAGLAVLILLSRSQWFQAILTPLIRRVLHKAGFMDLQDYASVLHVSEGYGIAEIEVKEGAWLGNPSLRDLRLRTEGVSVLGLLRRGQDYIGAPPPEQTFREGDRVIAYGRNARLVELASRRQDDVDAQNDAQREHRDYKEASSLEP